MTGTTQQDLRKILFEELDRLTACEGGDGQRLEIERSKAVGKIADCIHENTRLNLMIAEQIGDGGIGRATAQVCKSLTGASE